MTQEQLRLGAENKLKTVEAEQKQKVAVAEAEASALRAILVDAETCAELGDRVASERLGPVAFRGKALPVEVFAVPCGGPAAGAPTG